MLCTKARRNDSCATKLRNHSLCIIFFEHCWDKMELISQVTIKVHISNHVYLYFASILMSNHVYLMINSLFLFMKGQKFSDRNCWEISSFCSESAKFIPNLPSLKIILLLFETAIGKLLKRPLSLKRQHLSGFVPLWFSGQRFTWKMNHRNMSLCQIIW